MHKYTEDEIGKGAGCHQRVKDRAFREEGATLEDR